jgi:uncharacterized protein (DUF169 family)
VHRERSENSPLAAASLEPDVVLLWLTPPQAMLYNEAAGRAQWTTPPLTVRGRPACVDCMAMRTFTAKADDRLLVVLPGGQVTAIAAALERIAQANATMHDYYAQEKALFP